MSAARVLHFGRDTSHRVTVLRSEGYTVESCATLEQMIRWFRTGQAADLLCISEDPSCAAEGALAVARAYSRAPLVLFRANYHRYVQRSWNLEVHPLTPPEVWLRELARLLAVVHIRESKRDPVAID